jgi:hypothetical protein
MSATAELSHLFRALKAPAAAKALPQLAERKGAPIFAAMTSGDMEDQGAGGGWPEVLSSMKTLLETGEALR